MDIPWVIKEQTNLKLRILKSYISPWSSILFKQAKKINVPQHLLYIDGFCGPGTYFENDAKISHIDGSPLIVAKIANEMIAEDPKRKFDIICIDKEKKCLDILKPELDKLNKYNQKWIIKNHLFEDEIKSILDNSILPPTFCFIDPFGYSINIEIIMQILSEPMSEVFVNFMIYDVMRALGNDKMEENLISLFGDENYKNCSKESPEERQAWILTTYCKSLKKHTNADYVLPFRVNTPTMHDRPRFYLIHLSNSIKALKTMKNSMMKFSTTEFTLEALGRKEDEYSIYDIFKEIDFKEKIFRFILAKKVVSYDVLEDWAYENTCGISKTIKQKVVSLEKEEKIKIDRLPRQRKSTVNGEARIMINE